MKRMLAGSMAVLVLAGLTFGQAKRFQLSLYGGMTRVMAYGSDGAYAAGSNDFPVTPAHTPTFFGASLTYSLTNRLGLELRGDYTLGSNMTLTDPSDNDTVDIQSSKHMSLSLNLLWALASGRFEPYLIAGAGIDKISSSAATYISTYGYEVDLSAPSKTLDFFLTAGAGVRWNFSSSLGLFIEGRCRYLFASPDKIQSLAGAGGFGLKF